MTEFLLPVLAGFAGSLVLTRAAIAVFARLALVDRPGSEAHKQQERAVPYGGGAAMALALGGALALVVALRPPGPVMDDAAAARSLALLAGALALFVLGQVDDLRPLGARLKLALQLAIIVASVLAAGLRVDVLQEHPVLATALAVAWCVLVTNAYNLLDHADGFSATIALISATVLLSASLMEGDTAQGQLWLALIGVLAGFLVWNLPPARVYMGDAGSLPLGFLIGTGCLTVTFWPSGERGAQPLALLAPLLITAIPLYDMGVVIVRRVAARAPIMRGDRNHISHRLVRLGLSPRTSLAAVAALQTAIAASALQLRFADGVAASIAVLQAASILIAAVLLEALRDVPER